MIIIIVLYLFLKGLMFRFGNRVTGSKTFLQFMKTGLLIVKDCN